MNFTFPDEAIDHFVREVLAQDLEINKASLEKLKKKKKLKDFEKIDLADTTRVIDALEVVLEYYRP